MQILWDLLVLCRGCLIQDVILQIASDFPQILCPQSDHKCFLMSRNPHPLSSSWVVIHIPYLSIIILPRDRLISLFIRNVHCRSGSMYCSIPHPWNFCVAAIVTRNNPLNLLTLIHIWRCMAYGGLWLQSLIFAIAELIFAFPVHTMYDTGQISFESELKL